MNDQNKSLQRAQIVKFIQSLSEKNYAKANESLQKTIESKLPSQRQKRIILEIL